MTVLNSSVTASAVHETSLYGASLGRRVTFRDLLEAKVHGQHWPMLTSYDAITAGIFDSLGVPVLLVGDSAATMVYGYDTTIPVTMEDLLPLVRAVVRGSKQAMVVADMPFGSYQSSVSAAIHASSRFIKEGGAHAVKLEGGVRVVPQVRALVEAGIPVMAHVGLTPQSVHALGGYRVQGRGEDGQRILEDALALQDAGAFAVVLEVIPADLAAKITQALTIPTIGIGAGVNADAQVLVWQDLVGLTPGATPKFVTPYANVGEIITTAVRTWCDDVINLRYPNADQSYK